MTTRGLHRALFRLARLTWWRLPARLRDRVRPILFPPSGIRETLLYQLRGAPAIDVAARARTRRPLRDSVPLLPVTVSVIIPTADGGPIFRRALAMVRQQRGLERVELIVVDSGSADGSREAAARAGATVIDIPGTAFRHGDTRNVAASAASGDVLVMLVQDAVLLGPDALRALASELLDDERTAAVSARQVPRTDADLYACFVVFAHGAFLTRAGRSISTTPFHKLNAQERRAAASLDNVCAALRRSVWEDFRFADVPFAEDLELGIRIGRAGYVVRRSSAAAVAHSHTRGAVYHFRRSVADRLYVAALIGDERLSRAAGTDADDVLASGHALIEEMQGALARLHHDIAPLGEQLAAVRSGLGRGAHRVAAEGDLAQLAALLPPPCDSILPILREEVRAALSWNVLERFTAAHPATARADAAAFASKLVAAALGRCVGDALRAGGADETKAMLLRGV